MTIGRRLELILLALYNRPDEMTIQSYAIDEQKIFKTPRKDLLYERRECERLVEDLGRDFDYLTSSMPPRDLPIGYGRD